ncbi:uncharacterized protein K452DRAFT_302973 [Aplosporella prunicola CBS 121167]|uniref:Uncharacterized protein n=1 Tax=Aplosporella prunicola CBS 121167 TaxID=1176127 RepID=A0A6A6AY27_9PEZI|nr:uncharacterized protein K452DRAFT_302973 [Aplosporella prunicola CBS 121167]KAF2136168.1 hypothetical protein K452DRAFT_302973 [Aplosporella prunicola CBS 121167]
MQANGERKQSLGLEPPPSLNFGFPSPGTFTPAGSIDSPTLPDKSSYSPAGPPPPADVVLENSKHAVAEGSTPQPSGKARTSKSLDVNDPVHMHLLVETAVGDSLAYDVLSFEELEALKKERVSLVGRMEAVGQKLALESKVRDAAVSLNRLYGNKRPGSSAGSPKLHRRSISRSSNGSTGSAQVESVSRSENELATSQKKCDELSRELWQMERRFRDIESQMLKHTAGILQMTHKGPTKRSRSRQSLINNNAQGGRPDSPASIFTYENAGARSPVRHEDKDNFDERSLYRSPDNLDKLVDALKYGKALTTRTDPFTNGDSEVQTGTLQSVENRLEDLNDRLRQLIIQANPDTNKEYDAPPKHTADGNAGQQAANVEERLDYLDQGLRDLEAEQSNMQQHHQDTRHAHNALEGRLEGINNHLYQLAESTRTEDQEEQLPQPPPPQISGQGAQEQMEYMQEVLYAIEQSQQKLLAQVSEQPKEQMPASVLQEELQFQLDNYESSLNGLWQIIVAGEEEARQRKAQRRQMLEADPDGTSDLDDMSPDEEPLSSDFSMPLFTSKVQTLFSKASSLKEKNAILRRQIKQQRELNSKSDAEREQQVLGLHDEISRLREQAHNNTGNSDALEQEEQARHVAENKAAEASAQLAEAESKLSQLDESLQAANASRENAEKAVHEKEEQLKKTEDELKELETQVVKLQTEVTIARAELDGAYGTRAQRAADIAGNPAIREELDALGERNIQLTIEVQRLQEAHATAAREASQVSEREKLLRVELRDTIAEFEEITKANVENEKEREGLEGVIDGLREKVERLEGQLADEKVRWLGVNSPGAPNGGMQETTSITVLRVEFKKMMRETRGEVLRALRSEQEERRRLEQLLRALKKEQLPQKSRMSQNSQNLTAA